MDEFTSLDWFIAGTIFVVGIVGAMIKAFCIDDPEIKEYHQYKNRKKR